MAATRALERLMTATVRVGSGTGVLVANGSNTVVVTANHVTPSDAEGVDGAVRVWAGDAWADCTVLARDAESDLSIVAAPPALDGQYLRLLERELVPGEEIWTCGHPRGWRSIEAPVLCRGIVAGVAEERWANLEASWGNSGGALVLTVGDHAMLGGITLARAGEAHTKLDDLRSEAYKNVESLGVVFASLKRAIAEGDGIRKVLDEKEAQFDPPDEAVSVAAATVRRSLKTSEDRMVEIGGLLRVDSLHFQTLSVLTDLVDRHFRTGFVRFAGATVIRKLLGEG